MTVATFADSGARAGDVGVSSALAASSLWRHGAGSGELGDVVAHRRGRRRSRSCSLAALVVGVVTLVGRSILTSADRQRRRGHCAHDRRPGPATAPSAHDPDRDAPPVPSIAPAVSRIDTTEKVIFLGIDDGLTRDPAVLDYLQANRIPFTAFLVRARSRPTPRSGNGPGRSAGSSRRTP